MVEFESKRTIEEVLDLETGEIILSKEFFKQSEDKVIYFRRVQQEAISGIRAAKFVCIYCHQIVKISGKPTQRGIVSFFAHLHDSEECEIKTNGNYSKEEIEAIKYAGIKESQRHIDLKEKIYKALTDQKSKELEINNVEVEKRFISNNPLLNWRRPDLYAEYKNKKVVFELQLSTTFLSVIVARDIFYKLNNTFIIWIFNFSSNEEYVNLGNLMCKDIYYANKRNAFVYDEKAIILSEQQRELILLCIWFEPIIENGKLVHGRGSIHKEYVKFSELNFDDKELKPYYVDADKMFLSYYPEQLVERTKNELESEKWLKKVEENNQKKFEQKRIEKESKEKEQERKINEIIAGIRNGVYELNPLQKNGKWGYESQGELIIKPIYSFADKYGESRFAKVKRGRKFGLLNKLGKEILPCIYDEIFEYCKGTEFIKVKKDKKFGYTTPLGVEIIPCLYDEIFEINNDRYVVKIAKEWSIIDDKNSKIEMLSFDNISIFQEGLDLLKITRKETVKTLIGQNYGGYNIYSSNHTYYEGLMDFNGNVLIPANYNYISLFEQGKATGIIDQRKGIIEFNDNKLKCFIYAIEDFNDHGIARAKKNGLFGFVNKDKTEVIPFIYDMINPFEGGTAKAKRNDVFGCIDLNGNEIIDWVGAYSDDGVAIARKFGLFGFIDLQGNEVFPFVYDSLESFIDGRAKAKKNDLWGYIDLNGHEVIPIIFDQIESFINGIAKAKKNDLWGYIDVNGYEVIPVIFDLIESFNDGIARAKKNGQWGYIDLEGNEIMPCVFDLIEPFRDNKAIAKKNGLYGYIDLRGNVIIPFNYDAIETFENGRAKAKRINYWGYIDDRGNEVIGFVFDWIEKFNLGKAKAKKEGLWGYIDVKGATIIDFLYHEIEDRNNEYYKVNRLHKWGYIDYSGKVVVKIIYDKLYDFDEGPTDIRQKDKTVQVYGLAKYTFSTKRGYVSKTGQEYWQYWKD